MLQCELPEKVWSKQKKIFANTYKFCNHDINMSNLLLWKSVHSYENIVVVREKRYLQSSKYARYYWYRLRTQTVCKDFEIMHLGKCHDLYVKSYTLLVLDVFNIVQSMCFEMHWLDPALFFWQTALKETKIKLDLLTKDEYNLCCFVIKTIN